MTHPDGQIALFNDAAFGIAATADDLAAYAGRVLGNELNKELCRYLQFFNPDNTLTSKHFSVTEY